MNALNKIGKVTDFIISIFLNLVTPPIYGREILKAFTKLDGCRASTWINRSFYRRCTSTTNLRWWFPFNAEQVVPAIVAIGMARELGPVLGGLIVAARVASSMRLKSAQ